LQHHIDNNHNQRKPTRHENKTIDGVSIKAMVDFILSN